MVESTLVRIPSVLVQSQHRSLISHLQPLTSHLSPFVMPPHPRSSSPAAAEKLRRALLALAAAATAVVAAPGCTISGARPQKPIDDIPLGGIAPPADPIDWTPPPASTKAPTREPRVAGAPVPPPRTDDPPVLARTLPPKDGFSVYTVQPGDTLSAIAQRHEVLQKSIVEANGLADPNRIRAGRQLYIPTEKDPSYTQRTGGRFLFAP